VVDRNAGATRYVEPRRTGAARQPGGAAVRSLPLRVADPGRAGRRDDDREGALHFVPLSLRVRPERMTLRLAELHSGAAPADVPGEYYSPVPHGEPTNSGGLW
jgi:hypothetical protein